MGIELFRVVVAVVVVPLLLLLLVGLATCAAGRPRSEVDETPAAVKEEAGPPPVGIVSHAVQMRCRGVLRTAARGGRPKMIAVSLRFQGCFL